MGHRDKLLRVGGRGARALVIAALAALAVAVGLGACAGAAKTAMPEYKPVVRVGASVLTELDLEEELQKIMPRLFHKQADEAAFASYRPAAMEKLIEGELLYQEALRAGLSVDARELDAAYERLAASMGGQARLKETLKLKGVTEKQYMGMLQRQRLIGMIEEREVTQKAAVTEQDALEHYRKNAGAYLRPAAWRVSHILISVDPSRLDEKDAKRQRAEHVLKLLGEGTEFSSVAWDYSDDSYKYKGGDLGLVHEGRIMPELEEVIKGLPVGVVSPAIETMYGFHVLKVSERFEPTQLQFEEVSQQIARKLTEENTKRLREELLSRLREKAEIEVY